MKSLAVTCPPVISEMRAIAFRRGTRSPYFHLRTAKGVQPSLAAKSSSERFSESMKAKSCIRPYYPIWGIIQPQIGEPLPASFAS